METEIETCSTSVLRNAIVLYDKCKCKPCQINVEEAKRRLHNLETGKTKLAWDHKDMFGDNYIT